MRIYDISQEVFSSAVYPGDPKPEKRLVSSIEKGELYNLTELSMCAHNGTHLDAPAHFIKDGDTVDKIPLEKTVGKVYVCARHGNLSGADAVNVIEEAKVKDIDCARKILINGDAVITESAAEVFAEAEIDLIGVTTQSVGPEGAPMAVHKILLEKKVVLLEGLRLEGIEDGVYFLCAQPLKLGGSDGAPVRAVLVDFGK